MSNEAQEIADAIPKVIEFIEKLCPGNAMVAQAVLKTSSDVYEQVIANRAHVAVATAMLKKL